MDSSYKNGIARGLFFKSKAYKDTKPYKDKRGKYDTLKRI
jgi:hypothetical protein